VGTGFGVGQDGVAGVLVQAGVATGEGTGLGVGRRGARFGAMEEIEEGMGIGGAGGAFRSTVDVPATVSFSAGFQAKVE
jgi:hypothetical protein